MHEACRAMNKINAIYQHTTRCCTTKKGGWLRLNPPRRVHRAETYDGASICFLASNRRHLSGATNNTRQKSSPLKATPHAHENDTKRLKTQHKRHCMPRLS